MKVVRVAVQFCKDTPNPMNLPPLYPHKVREMKDGESCPLGWTEMRLEDLEALKDRMKGEVSSLREESQKKVEDNKDHLIEELNKRVSSLEEELRKKEEPQKSFLDSLKFWRKS